MDPIYVLPCKLIKSTNEKRQSGAEGGRERERWENSKKVIAMIPSVGIDTTSEERCSTIDAVPASGV